MAIQLGSSNVNDIMLGSSLVNQIYLGTQLIYERGGKIKKIELGVDNAYILESNGTLWGVGEGSAGQLSTNNADAKVFGVMAIDVVDVYSGKDFVYALKKDGTWWVCGENGLGQLGLGHTTNRYVFYQNTASVLQGIKQMSCGGEHVLIIGSDNKIYSVGGNTAGQLGRGHTNNNTTTYSFAAVSFASGKTPKQVLAGNGVSFALATDGTLYCAGMNTSGQYGDGGITLSSTFKASSVTGVDKLYRCKGNSMFIRKTDGTIWCVGSNGLGQLGLGNTTTPQKTYVKFDKSKWSITEDIEDVVNTSTSTFLLTNKGNVYSIGDNAYGQLALGTGGNTTAFSKVNTSNIKTLYPGWESVAAVKNDDTVWFAGKNDYYGLGMNHTTHVKVFTQPVNWTPSYTEHTGNYTVQSTTNGLVFGTVPSLNSDQYQCGGSYKTIRLSAHSYSSKPYTFVSFQDSVMNLSDFSSVKIDYSCSTYASYSAQIGFTFSKTEQTYGQVNATTMNSNFKIYKGASISKTDSGSITISLSESTWKDIGFIGVYLYSPNTDSSYTTAVIKAITLIK